MVETADRDQAGSSPDRSLEKKEVTRQRILDAAIEVFAEKGYHDSAVDDIVRVSNTSKGSVYFHFPNKQGLFLVLVEYLANLLTKKVEASIGPEKGGIAKVEAALNAVVRTLSSHRNLAKILLIEVVGLGDGFDPRLLEVRNKLVAVIKRYLDRAVAEGSIPPQDTEIAAYAWLGTINEVIVRWLYTGKPDPLESALPALRSLLLRSIGFPLDSSACSSDGYQAR